MSTERGFAIQETVRAMAEERYLRQLAQQRDKRMAQKKRKIESSSAALDAEKEKERKEALKEYQKEWRSKNRDKVKEYNRRYSQKKKEACTGATVQTSCDVNVNKTLHNYTKETEECQDGTFGNNLDRETGEQFRRNSLPVYLL